MSFFLQYSGDDAMCIDNRRRIEMQEMTLQEVEEVSGGNIGMVTGAIIGYGLAMLICKTLRQ